MSLRVNFGIQRIIYLVLHNTTLERLPRDKHSAHWAKGHSRKINRDYALRTLLVYFKRVCEHKSYVTSEMFNIKILKG